MTQSLAHSSARTFLANHTSRAAIEAQDINAHIARGRAVHFQSSAVFPWRRIIRATPDGATIRFDFADGGFRVGRCWSSDDYTLGWNLSRTTRAFGREMTEGAGS